MLIEMLVVVIIRKTVEAIVKVYSWGGRYKLASENVVNRKREGENVLVANKLLIFPSGQ